MSEARAALLLVVEDGLPASTAQPMTAATWLDEAALVPWLPADSSDAAETPTPTPSPDEVTTRRSRDVATLVALVRGGALIDQRIALARLVELAQTDPDSTVDVELGADEIEPELEWEHLQFLEARGRAEARESRTTMLEMSNLLAVLEERFRHVVDGHEQSDPLAELDPTERASVMLHLRSASDFTLACILDRLEGDLRSPSPLDALERIVALRSAADPRTLPVLAHALLTSSRGEIRAQAARALARIDDPRVVPILEQAHQTASEKFERLALIEALGMQGQLRDVDYLREILTSEPFDGDAPTAESAPHLVACLDAVVHPELLEIVVRFSVHAKPDVQRAAIRAMGRIGDDTAIAYLDRIGAGEPHEGLEAELEAARSAVLARVELRGDPRAYVLDERRRAARKRALAKKFSRGVAVPPTRRHRALAWLLMLRARLAVFFGAKETAKDLCDRAYQADPGWHVPSMFLARLGHRAGDIAAAVAGYRKGLPYAPRRLTHSRRWITPIVEAFVARAEQLLQDGHIAPAHALLEDLWTYDTSRAAPRARLALRRCRQRLAYALSTDTPHALPPSDAPSP